MDLYAASRTMYDIPLNHLDHGYVSKCKDKIELEKIIKILRSGKEGTYPDLEKCAEEQLKVLDPKNKLLLKPDTLKKPRDIDKEEWKEIDEDLQSWMDDVRLADEKISHSSEVDESLPPVRNSNANINISKTSKVEDASSKAEKRVKPRDYREWDKFDIEAELEKAETDNKSQGGKAKRSNKPSINDLVNAAGLVDEVAQMKAEREKNKGNEAFHAGDFEEALTYYNRSLNFRETVAARNNRAQAYLKLKKWNLALDDCEVVLTTEPSNLKALLRRAVANQGLNRYAEAQKDVDDVLAIEPTNRQALEVKKALDKVSSEKKAAGRRMVIEDVEGSDAEEKEAELNKKNSQKSAAAATNTATSGVNTAASTAKPDAVKVLPANQTGTTKKDNEVLAKTGISPKSIEEVTSTGGDGSLSKTLDAIPMSTNTSLPSKSSPAVTSGDGEPQPPAEPLPPAVPAQPQPPAQPLPPAVQALKDDGNDLFRKGQYGDAIEKYSAALRILSGMGRDAATLSTLYSNRAACMMKIGDCQGCIIDCDSALALAPGSSKAFLRRALAYETLEKYRLAYVDYRQVLLADSTAEIAQQGSDRCASMLQRLDGPGWREKLPSVSSNSNLVGMVQAPESVESQSANNEKTFETLKAQGNSSFSKGDFSVAIDLFSKCIELFPDRVVPYTNRALCYLRFNKYDSVLSDCNQALTLEFHNVKALFRRAQAYKMLERYEESMIDLETLLKIDPSNTPAKKELQAVFKLKEEERDKRLQASLRRHRQRVRIEEVDTSSDEEQPVKKTAEANLEKNTTCGSQSETAAKSQRPQSATVPQLSRVTAFEFMQAWSSLKGSTDVELYLKVLDQIQPNDLPKVVTNKLDSDFLVTVVRCVGQLISRGDALRGFEFLVTMTTLPRFDTIALFVSDTEKKEFSNVFQQLSSASVDSSQLAATRKKYGVQ